LCKKGRYARAKEILIEMLTIGPGPDTTTHNTLPVGSCRKDNSSEAEEIFGVMLCRGVVPDLVSFSSLIAVFSRNKYLDQALVYFGDMKKFGSGKCDSHYSYKWFL
jgi:pentatricopeptide repeat protein